MLTKAVFLSFFCLCHVTLAFLPRENFVAKKGALESSTLLPLASDANRDSGDTRSSESSSMPQLPAFGGSSHVPGSTSLSNNTDVALVDRKFDLLYTCNRCETRNSHRVSRIAYNKGVVISTCKGCKAQHLIADHLGFTKLWDKEDHGNIEEYLANQVDSDAQVSRVTKDMFHLEKIHDLDTKSGAIFDNNGNVCLE